MIKISKAPPTTDPISFNMNIHLMLFIFATLLISSCSLNHKRDISSITEDTSDRTSDPFCSAMTQQYKALGSPTRMLLIQTNDSTSSNPWSTFKASAQLMEKNASGQWEEIGEKFPFVVGKKGMALAHNLSEFASLLSAPIKKEGDGKTPLGLHLFGKKFGFESDYYNDSNYRQITPDTHCVDDIQSKYYNKVVDLDANKSIGSDWKSSEKMINVKLYELGAEIDYKSNAKKAAGSCIFLHLWRSSSQGTAGCVATDKSNVESILNFAKDDIPVLAAIFTSKIYSKVKNCF